MFPKIKAGLKKFWEILKVFADEDIKAQRNSHEPIQVPVGPVTRARAKRFKEELNNLVRKVRGLCQL